MKSGAVKAPLFQPAEKSFRQAEQVLRTFLHDKLTNFKVEKLPDFGVCQLFLYLSELLKCWQSAWRNSNP